MRIWWCQEHKMAAAEAESEEPNDCPAMFLGWMHGKPCRLVPMRLIPDNAETANCGTCGGTGTDGFDRNSSHNEDRYVEYPCPACQGDREVP